MTFEKFEELDDNDDDDDDDDDIVRSGIGGVFCGKLEEFRDLFEDCLLFCCCRSVDEDVDEDELIGAIFSGLFGDGICCTKLDSDDDDEVVVIDGRGRDCLDGRRSLTSPLTLGRILFDLFPVIDEDDEEDD
eukprot:CAMPEP_0174820298 /NCGR_PEP_ID=MMETSP1107-20130205/4028_1 /TAXON_ID=36770 /ORGANISM="Paraphysomonas vestita, Strain GFlagA" /LENGTH=131 /DNA_ID=CAMNT_0016035335 /DNA_START=554 /DNA_END=950 /DNA_ORIENTATION=-